MAHNKADPVQPLLLPLKSSIASLHAVINPFEVPQLRFFFIKLFVFVDFQILELFGCLFIRLEYFPVFMQGRHDFLRAKLVKQR
ncbi:Uncharacterised protein [Mycobacteroides abscessus subsp. abscessus]|nr:Uncharacterised protein [Mycobacteroides abscessus subsp. abscessus]